MSTVFSVKGNLKIKFLICPESCHDCKTESCPNEKKIIELLEEVTIILPENQKLRIDPGFHFDGASIPRICWTSIGHPLEHRFIFASLLHDALYVSQYVERAVADRYFYDFLRDYSGVGSFTAWKMYTGVRLFGGDAWREKTDSMISDARKLIALEENAI